MTSISSANTRVKVAPVDAATPPFITDVLRERCAPNRDIARVVNVLGSEALNTHATLGGPEVES